MQKAQGATEYLVLLAVVLIIALVSIALLGFFPGMAQDQKENQAKLYWQSATPLAVVEYGASLCTGCWTGDVVPIYLRIRNTGSYPIRITKVLGDNSTYATIYYDGLTSQTISSLFYLAPGEEKYFGRPQSNPGLPANQFIYIGAIGATHGTGSMTLDAASSFCNAASPYGTLVVKNFGFEYTVVIEGQSITKRQVGIQPLTIRCGASTA